MSVRRSILHIELCTQHQVQLMGEGWALGQEGWGRPVGVCGILGCDSEVTHIYWFGAFMINSKGNSHQVVNFKEAPQPRYPDLKR